MDILKREEIDSLVNENLILIDPEGTQVELKVVEVESTILNGDEWDSFHVILEGTEAFHVPQGTYKFAHEKLGEIDMFMSPNSQTEYEIVVSRKRDT